MKSFFRIYCFREATIKQCKGNSNFSTKKMTNIKYECDAVDQSKYFLTYQILDGSFTMTHNDETRFLAGSGITLVTPPFTLFIADDLTYYADVLGMPNSTSYWCPWCFLSHSEWNKPPETLFPKARSLNFLSEMPLAVKNDAMKRLKPIMIEEVYHAKGIINALDQINLSPLLHLEMGMVNQAWEAFEEWVNDVVEVVLPIERGAQKDVQDAREK
jgi:hypothetical protein